MICNIPLLCCRALWRHMARGINWCLLCHRPMSNAHFLPSLF